MKKQLCSIIGAAAILLLPFGAMAQEDPPVHSTPETWGCFPTCAEDDAKFLTIAGSDIETIIGNVVDIQFAAPAGSTEDLIISIFDGDAGGRWDLNVQELNFEVYLDPDGDGSGPDIPGATPILDFCCTDLLDNAWKDFEIPLPEEGIPTPSGNVYFVMRISPSSISVSGLNNFKVRSNNLVLLPPQLFSFIGAVHSMADGRTIYPAYPGSLTPTTYDGSWDFFFDVRGDATSVVVWDGDFDFAGRDCSGPEQDTDDPDTPNDVIPPWAGGTSVTIEGVAAGIGTCPPGSVHAGERRTGDPPDDNSNPLTERAGDISYYVHSLGDELHFDNDNPSGNREVEQFRIETDPDIEADHYVTGPLTPGIWHFHSNGLDLQNLNAIKLPFMVCVHPDGTPCYPVYPYVIGDTVWYDFDGNGEQGLLEPGFPGVTVSLYGTNGALMKTTVTDDTGWYSFEVPAGTYTVEVDAANFVSGGTLEGYVSTTGGESQTDMVVDVNVLDYDFGYNIEFCGDCDGRATELTFVYLGTGPGDVDAAYVEVEVNKTSKGEDPIRFAEMVYPGDFVSVSGGWKSGTLGTEIEIFVDYASHIKIHTSCSAPLHPGLIYGDFLLVAGESRNGGAFCPIGE